MLWFGKVGYYFSVKTRNSFFGQDFKSYFVSGHNWILRQDRQRLVLVRDVPLA